MTMLRNLLGVHPHGCLVQCGAVCTPEWGMPATWPTTAARERSGAQL